MKMANILMPKGTIDSHVNSGAHVDADLALAGAVAVYRGPIADIAAADATVVVTNFGDDSVTLFNAEALAVEHTLAVDGEPSAVVLADDRAYVSTSSASHDAVSVIDTTSMSVIATYPLAFGVTALAISPDGKRVYAGRTAHDHVDVAVIDITAERVGTIDIAGGAGIGIDAIAVDSRGKRLYVATTDALGSQLAIVDAETSSVVRTVPIGSPIRDLAVAGGTAYVLTSDRVRGGVVNVVDLSAGRITASLALGGAPTQMALSPDQARVYVVDYDQVVVVCARSLEVVNVITVDARPSCVAVSADGDRLHVADYAGMVTVFSVASATRYSQWATTDPIALRRLRALEPATA